MSEKNKMIPLLPRRSGAVPCSICKRTLPLTFFPDNPREMTPEDVSENLLCLTCSKLPLTSSGLIPLPVPNPEVLPQKPCTVEENEVIDIKGENSTSNQSCQCSFCDRTLCSPHSRVLHERLHTGEKPFECKTCGKRFHNPQYYRLHSTVHTGVNKPYQCEVCNRRFRLLINLTTHKKSHTSEEKPYIHECKKCSRKFRKKKTLRKHTCTQPDVIVDV